MGHKNFNKEEQLNRIIGVRVSTQFYNKLDQLRSQSNCQTLGEFVRHILHQDKINFYHKKPSHDAIAIELTSVRKELKAIGININQVTKYFNSTQVPAQKIYESLRILDEFKKVNTVVDSVLTITDKLLQEWLSE